MKLNILLLLISYVDKVKLIGFVSMVQTPINNPLKYYPFLQIRRGVLYFISDFLNVVKIKIYIYVNIGRMDIVITSIIGLKILFFQF